MTWSFILLVLLVVAVLVISKFTTDSPATIARSHLLPTASPALMKAIANLPASEFNEVGVPQSGTLTPPIALYNQMPLVADGLPAAVSIDAGYCDYCAAQRWAVVVALSRFGTFSKLSLTSSSTTTAYPGIATFSFDGATFQSQYLSFEGLEVSASQPLASGGYEVLESPTPTQQGLLRRYDAPPYVSASADGLLPFVDIGNRAIWTGAAGLSPAALMGLSSSQIAALLPDASSNVTKAIVGTANEMSAAICSATGGKPSQVCSTPAIAEATAALAAG